MRTMPSGLISATQQEKKKHTTHDTRDIQNINKHYQFLRIVLLLTSPASMSMHRLTDMHAHALSMALWVTHASGAGGCPFTNLHFHILLEIWVLQHFFGCPCSSPQLCGAHAYKVQAHKSGSPHVAPTWKQAACGGPSEGCSATGQCLEVPNQALAAAVSRSIFPHDAILFYFIFFLLTPSSFQCVLKFPGSFNQAGCDLTLPHGQFRANTQQIILCVQFT